MACSRPCAAMWVTGVNRLAEQSSTDKQLQRDVFFPSLVFFTDLAVAPALNAAIKPAVYAWRETDPEGTHRTNLPQLGGWHSPTDMHIRHQYRPLLAEIFEFMHGVFMHLGYDPDYEPACDSMWVNINPRHAYNRRHSHPNALWSGVYYLQTPENCGLLSLTDPRPQARVLAPVYDPERRGVDTWGEVYYQPVEGRLIVFPGWLEHETQPNLCQADGPEADRISISFNFFQQAVGDSRRRVVVRGDVQA